MKTALLATTFMWVTIFAIMQALFGCTPKTFSIGKGMSVKEIKIRPSESVYRVERYI